MRKVKEEEEEKLFSDGSSAVEPASLEDSFESHKLILTGSKLKIKPPKLMHKQPKQPAIPLSFAKSKIDWNLKYQFPKSINNLFDYSIKNKLDILNSNLEHKI